MKFTSQELDMLKIIIENELAYYESREDLFEDEKEYVEDLKRMYEKIVEGDD